jgi:hypothetical protein
MTAIDRRYEPRQAVADEYAAVFDLFLQLRREMGSIWSKRAAVFGQSIPGAAE